jgi:uncharacterized protein YjbK
MIEEELKFILSREEAFLLVPHPDDAISQYTAYYDTKDGILLAKGATFRLRAEDGVWGITLKYPVEGHGAGLSKHREIEQPAKPDTLLHLLPGTAEPTWSLVDRFNIDDLDEAVGQVLSDWGVETLWYMGSTENLRYPVHEHVTLDFTKLPTGETTYELEIEAPCSCKRKEALRWVHSHIPVLRPSLTNKFARFQQAIRQLSGDQEATK